MNIGTLIKGLYRDYYRVSLFHSPLSTSKIISPYAPCIVKLVSLTCPGD